MSHRSSARSERFWSAPDEELAALDSLPPRGPGDRSKKRRPQNHAAVSDFRLRTKRLAAAVRHERGIDSLISANIEGETGRLERIRAEYPNNDDNVCSNMGASVRSSRNPRVVLNSTENDYYHNRQNKKSLTNQVLKKPRRGRARLYETFDDKTLEMRVDRMRLRMQTRLGNDFPRCLKPQTTDAAGMLSSEASSLPVSSRYFDRGQQAERDFLHAPGIRTDGLSDDDSILWLTDSDSASSSSSSSSSVKVVGSVPINQVEISRRTKNTRNGSESQVVVRNSCGENNAATTDDSDEMICSRSSDEEVFDTSDCSGGASRDTKDVAELFAALHDRDKTNIDRINICLLCDSNTCPRATVVRGACQARRCGNCFMWKHNASKCNHSTRNERSRAVFLQKANECFEDCMKVCRIVKNQIIQSPYPWSATCVKCEDGRHADPFKVNCGEPPALAAPSVDVSTHDHEKMEVSFFPFERHFSVKKADSRHNDPSYYRCSRELEMSVPPQPPDIWTGRAPLPPRPPPSCWPVRPYVEQRDMYHCHDRFYRRGSIAPPPQPYTAARAGGISAYGQTDHHDFGGTRPLGGTPEYRADEGLSVYSHRFSEPSFSNNSDVFHRYSSVDDGVANSDTHYGSSMVAGDEFLDSAYQRHHPSTYHNIFFQEPQREYRQSNQRSSHSGSYSSYHHHEQRKDSLYDSNVAFQPPNDEYPPLPPGK